MGLTDYIYTLTDTVKNLTPDLTSVYHYTDTVKNLTPDLTSVYHYSVSTVSNAGTELTGYLPDTKESRTKIRQKLGEYMPEDEARAKLGQFAWSVGKNVAATGVLEGAKLVPGGYFIHKTIEKSLPDLQKEDMAKTVKKLQARITVLEKQAAASGKSHNVTEIPSSDTNPNVQTAPCLDATMNFQKPEDVIRIFMMKEFVGREINQQIVENLMVPGFGKYRK